MTALIMANGVYSDPKWYQQRAQKYSYVICADGGADAAKGIGIMPDMIIGDLDSLFESDRLYLSEKGIQFRIFPPLKDHTDTYLALDAAAAQGISSIAIWGGTGGRLDHTLANLQNAAFFAKEGMSIHFESPSETIYIIKYFLVLEARQGDTVSVLSLCGKAEGVSLTGFRYPLENATLKADHPLGISNIIIGNEAQIRLDSGVLAVFHNHDAGL